MAEPVSGAPRDPNCCPAMNATRTTRTDAAIIHAGGPDFAPAGAPAALPALAAVLAPAAAPHEWQNLAPADSDLPHEVQGAVSSAAPQSAQYLPVAGLSHRGQGVFFSEFVTEGK